MNEMWKMHVCAVPACTSDLRIQTSDLSWHSFPSRDFQGWVTVLRQARNDPSWNPRTNERICSRHFNPSFIRGSLRKRICIGTNPSLNLFSAPVASLPDSEVDCTEEQIASCLTSENQSDSTYETSTRQIECPNCHHEFQIHSVAQNCSPSKKRKISVVQNYVPVSPSSIARVKLEHNYIRSPRTCAKKTSEENVRLKRKIKNARKTLFRKAQALVSVKDKLKSSLLLSETKMQMLQSQFPNLLQEIIQTEEQILKKDKRGVRYSEEMKKFAVTLHYYSPKAYEFVRNYLTLPHRSSLTAWMSSADNNPGFNTEIVKMLSKAVETDTKNMLKDIVLQVDEMAIRKGTSWDPTHNQYIGFVDFGAGKLDGDEALATNAMVLLIAGLSGGWKIPIGYVFTDKVNSTQMVEFVNRGIELVYENGLRAHTLTSDGYTANVSMFEKLGIVEKVQDGPMAFEDIVNDFPHPCDPSERIGAIYDVVHMMKLWRTLLAQCHEIEFSGGKLQWQFILELHKLQEKQQIVAANKIDRYHVDFQRHKMKAKYCLQVLSSSCADAIDFCRVDLGLPQFRGSETTTTFIRQIDHVFDILNSRHPAEWGQKAPLRLQNLLEKKDLLYNFAKSIMSMTYLEQRKCKDKVTVTKKLLVSSSRKRALLGTIISIKTVVQVAETLLTRSEHPFKYVLTYRFSQDLLELFFNKIRGRCGRNNNPSCLEFRNIMKKIWHQNCLKSTATGNCAVLVEEGEIPGGLLPLKRSKKSFAEDFDPVEILPDIASDIECSLFYKNCLAYIGGNVVRKFSETSKCAICVGFLFDCLADPLDSSLCSLINRKSRGSLITPCNSVYQLIYTTDRIFCDLVKLHNGPPRVNNLEKKIVLKVMTEVLTRNLFPHFQCHVLDFDPVEGESHLCSTMKFVVKHFLKIRLFDLGKRHQRSQNVSSRNNSLKMTHFRNE